MSTKKILFIVMSVSFLIGLLSFGISPLYDRPAAGSQPSAASITITDPDGVADTFADGSDFAALVLGDAWDMNEASDVYMHSSPHCELSRPFSSVTVSDGIWSGTSSAEAGDAPHFWLLFPGYKGTQQLGKVGSRYPIDTSKYYKLSFRLYLSQIQEPPGDPQPWDTIQIYWTDGDLGDFANGRCEISNTIAPVQGWHTYEVDLRTIGTQTDSFCTDQLGGWVGNVTGLRLDPISNNGVQVKLDWARLTGADETANKYTVQWTATDATGALVNLYLDDNTDDSDGLLTTIGESLTATTGSYQWTGRPMPPGDYYVYARMSSDYAATTMLDPWDMIQSSDVVESGGINITFDGNYLNGTTTQGGGYINLNVDALNYIDPAVYDKVVFRQYTNSSAKHYTLWWQNEDDQWVAYPPGNLPLVQGWYTYKVDLSGSAVWNNGQLKKNFRLLPVVQSGESFQLDWVALTTGAEPASEADLGPQTSYSSGLLTINTPPQVIINQPSMTSGVDYPVEALNNAWDMSDSADVDSTLNVNNPSFDNGLFQGTAKSVTQSCGDDGPWGEPNVMLQMGEPVDSSRFRYFTFKVKLDGTQDVGWGWVSRFIFLQVGYNNPDIPQSPGDHAVLNDMVLKEGWNTISVDLADNSQPFPNGLYDDEEASYSTWTSIIPTMLRFDPHEIPNSVPLTFSIDDIKLTAKDVADGTFDILWTPVDANGDNLTIKLYYTPSRSGTGTLITTLSGGETSYTWNTAAIAENEYYIHAEVNDGYNTTHWYSQSPVVISRGPNVTVTEPNGTGDAIIEGNDFANVVIGNRWDMDSSGDVKLSDISNITGFTVANGAASGTTSSTGSSYFGLNMDSEGIDPTTYTRLVWHQHTTWDLRTVSQFSLWWRNTDGSWAGCDSPDYLSIGEKTYTMDLTACTGWQNGKQKDHLRIYPAIQSGYQFEIDWINLVEPNSAQYTIQWNATNTDGATVSLYYDTDAFGNDGELIAADLPASTGSYLWDASALNTGDYYIYARIYNHVNAPVYDYSDNVLQVTIPQPTLDVTDPNGVGDAVLQGNEFSAKVVGNTWDMASSADVSMSDVSGISSFAVSGGKASGTTSVLGASYFGLNMGGQLIDPNIYTRLELRQSTTWDLTTVSQYAVWWRNTNGSWQGCNSPDYLVENWSTYTLNMGSCSGWQNGQNKTNLRIYPAIQPNYTFQIDWVKLYQPGSASYLITWTATDTVNATVALYYDTNNSGYDGILIASGLDPMDGSYMWDVSQLGLGNYYVYAKISYPQVYDYGENALRVVDQTGAVLSVINGSLNLLAESGGGDYTTADMTVTNLGLISFDWTITAPDWLIVTPPNGTDGPVIVTLTPDASSLPAGTYSGNLVVDGGDGGTETIPVKLVVVDDLVRLYIPVIQR
jgi:hypothetical protein